MRGVLLVALLLVPGAGAAPTTLHWHMLDGLQDGVLSTQPVPAEMQAVNGVPAFVACADVPPVLDPQPHPWRAAPSLSGAWYETGENGEPYVFGSQGLGRNLTLASMESTLDWFVVPAPQVDGTPAAPLPAPIVAQAEVRTIPPFDSEQAGELLASGRSGPMVLALAASSGATYHDVGGQPVYGITIPVTWQRSAIALGERGGGYGGLVGFTVEVSLQYDTPCPEPAPALALRAHSSPGLRPALHVDPVDAVALELLGPTLVDVDGQETLAFAVLPQSVWGKYDIANVTAAVIGPDGTALQAALRPPFARFHEHSPDDPHAGGAPIGRVFTVPAEDLPPGTYTIQAQATDLAGTASAQAVTTFEVADVEESPGMPFSLMALASVAAAVRVRKAGG